MQKDELQQKLCMRNCDILRHGSCHGTGEVKMGTGDDCSGMTDLLKNKYKKLWENTPDDFPALKHQYGALLQKQKDLQMNTFTDEIILLVKRFSNNRGEEDARWGTAMKKLIYGCGTGIIGLDASSMRLLLEEGFCDVTSDFIHEARSFDAGIKPDDIIQALRNVWIMNCIQKLMGCTVEATPSIFAYSMLYPYTDNYLDAASIPAEEKRMINKRFERRLAGEPLEAGTVYEGRLFALVDRIESQFARSRHPLVYNSLIAIQQAQNRSLQQQFKIMPGNEPDILDISIEKGGSSVMADACLVKGNLTSEQAAFMFGFGVLLQLLDDLQDAAADKGNGHHTIFSATDAHTLESNTNRLIHFIYRVLDEDTCFASPDAMEIKSMIKKSIIFLLMGAVACNSSSYGRRYLQRLEAFSPLSFGYLKSFYKRIGREYGKLRIKLAVNPLEAPMAKAFAAGVI